MYFPGNYSEDPKVFYFILGYLFSSCVGHTSFFSLNIQPTFNSTLFTCSWLEAMEIQKENERGKKKQYFKQQLSYAQFLWAEKEKLLLAAM